MLKEMAAAVLSLALVAGCAATGVREAVRLDASSAEAAEASYKAMMRGRSPAEQQKLALAVLTLNMQGVKSARDVVANPALQSPSVSRIRDQLAGLTAEQIIDLAAKSKGVRVQAVEQ